MKPTTCWATLALAVLLPSGASAAALLNEGFDDINTLVGGGWALTNNSTPGGSTGWFQGTNLFSAFSGPADSYVAANFVNAGFPGNISNWLITPQLSFFGQVQITFYTRAQVASPFPDNLELYLSTSGASTDVGNTDTSTGVFTSLLLAVNPTLSVGGYPEDWTQYSATVNFNSPASGRFAFRYAVPDTSLNADFIGIDEVNVTDSPVPEPGTLGLLAMGGMALGFARFRRAQR